MEPQLPDYLTTAQKNAESASATASNLGAYAGSMPDLLKKSIQKAYNDNQDVISQLDTATANYLQSPSEARVKYQDIWNPFQRENLVSQYTSNQAIPMLSYSGIYGQRMGRAGDLLSAGVGAYESDVAAKNAAANIANQAYQNALDQYKLEEDRRRWEAEQAGQGSMLDAILNALKNQEQGGSGAGDDFEPETPGQIAAQYNAPINTSPNLANTGNATVATPSSNSIYNAGISSPFTGSIDIGSAPQAPVQRQGINNWLRNLLGWQE